jgi:transcriptional regulator of arginine metabolism
MKSERQNKILEIISGNLIETQEDLLRKLREAGVKTTQATVSRDIKELHLVKEQTGQGQYRYSVSMHTAAFNLEGKLRVIFKESITSYDCAQNIVVLKTMPGLAPAACAALDGMDIACLVGTIAGDDTALLIMRDNDSAEAFCEEINRMLQ